MNTVRELVKHNPLLQEMLAQWVARLDLTDPYRLADFATALTSGDGHDLQRVLEVRRPSHCCCCLPHGRLSNDSSSTVVCLFYFDRPLKRRSA